MYKIAGLECIHLRRVLILQVDVEVESMDKRGSFIGWLYVDEVNLSVALVEAGLSKVHFSAELSSHFSDLQEAEKLAKAKRINVRWYGVVNGCVNVMCCSCGVGSLDCFRGFPVDR